MKGATNFVCDKNKTNVDHFLFGIASTSKNSENKPRICHHGAME